MNKKIDEGILDKLKIECYTAILGEEIDQASRDVVKKISEDYLRNHDYKIQGVKCNQENNPPSVLNDKRIVVWIQEEDFPGSAGCILHEIIL